jgi:hypothetical protein
MFQLSAELRLALLNYLATKPYQEVAAAIQALQQLPPIEKS